MNGAEQKTHRTVTDALRREAADAAVMTASLFESLDQRLREEATARCSMAAGCDARWLATAEAQKRIADRFDDFERQGFWSRLNWLLTGR